MRKEDIVYFQLRDEHVAPIMRTYLEDHDRVKMENELLALPFPTKFISIAALLCAMPEMDDADKEDLQVTTAMVVQDAHAFGEGATQDSQQRLCDAMYNIERDEEENCFAIEVHWNFIKHYGEIRKTAYQNINLN